MASTLTWLAHSESERRQTQEIIRLLEEPGTRDELGFGRIRDALADLLFPGTSTLHTRARYFLFVPWIYQGLEAESPVANPSDRARMREAQLISALKRQRELDGNELGDGTPLDTEGIIGVSAGAALVQLPSQAYWQGLHKWRIRRAPGTRAAYHRFLARTSLRDIQRDDDGEPLPGAVGSWWDPVPKAPAGLLDVASLALRPNEAEYLRERISVSQPGSALAQLLLAGAGAGKAEFVWELPAAELSALDHQNRAVVEHAERFSLMAFGALILYIIMVAEEAQRDPIERDHREALDLWQDEVHSRREELREWRSTLESFWTTVGEVNPHVPSRREKDFVEDWCDRALDGNRRALSDDVNARERIKARESQLKRGHARLGNRSALEAWGGAGAFRLNFRWSISQRHLIDIEDGLARGTDAAEVEAVA